MLCSNVVFLGRFAMSNQVSQSFMLLVRDPDRREITSSMGAREFLSIAAIRFHAVARGLGNERRRDHDALDAEAHQLPVKSVTGRSRLVADTELLLLPELAQNAANRSDFVRHRPKRPHLAAHFGYRNCYRRSMYVQTYKFDILRHRPALLSCGSALVPHSSSVTHGFECVSRSCYSD
jgi:hypothetical protein